jgi:Cadherin domain
VTVDSTGHWSDDITLTTVGLHQITAQDTDAAGNVGVSSAISVTYQPVQSSTLAPPVITSDGGGRSGSIFIIASSTFANEPANYVTRVMATDPNPGHKVSYQIVGGADADQFSIDATTGVLTFLSAPDAGTYRVRVAAVDNAPGNSTTLQSMQSLKVTVGTSQLSGDSAPNHDTFELGHFVGSVKLKGIDMTRDTFVFDKTMFASTSDLVANATDVVSRGQHQTVITYDAPAGQPAEHDTITLADLSLTAFKAAIVAHLTDFHFI